MPRKRLYDLLEFFPVDQRTLLKAAKSAGAKITHCGKSGPLIELEDFEIIKTEGFEYYKDRMTTEGIR